MKSWGKRGNRMFRLGAASALVSLIGLATAACGTGADGGDGDAIVLNVSHNQATATFQHEVLEAVAGKVEADTGGAVRLELFPDSQLGAFDDVPEQFMAGAPVIGAVNAPVTANYGVPELAALNVPYIFEDPSEIATFAESDLYKEWSQKLREQGFVMIAFNWYQGERHIISNNPNGYATPADMSGDSIRIPGGENWAAFFGDLPINAQPLDGTETYTAMQQGIINGAEGPYSQLLGWSLDELGESVTLTGHNYDISGFATGEQAWDSLSGEQQKTVEAAFLWGGEEFSERMVEGDEELRKDLEATGLTFVEADRDAYADVAQKSITPERFPDYGSVLEDITDALGR